MVLKLRVERPGIEAAEPKFLKPTMIKLTAIEPKEPARLLLPFSDGSSGTFDFCEFIAARTEMTLLLADPAFFARHFIEAGALAWPNGFDLSAGSLHRRLEESGRLVHDAAAA